MSIWGRRISAKWVAALAVCMVVVAGLLPVTTKGRTRDIDLVARDMAFYLESAPDVANPVLEVKAGETLRVRLRNRDRGMTHDFAVPAAEASTSTLDWNEEDAVIFQAPSKPGTYEYLCRPHLLMMKGTLRVVAE